MGAMYNNTSAAGCTVVCLFVVGFLFILFFDRKMAIEPGCIDISLFRKEICW
jgi:hypothetical protein